MGIHRPSNLLHSSHNGCVGEEKQNTIDIVRSMMSNNLPKSFWLCSWTAARILNMVPSKKVEKTPYEVWHGPKMSYLKFWGCEALVKRDTLTKPDKLDPRVHQGPRHAPDRMCLYIDDEEHELGDLGEPVNYKAALLDPESELKFE
ncbi:hypothetical protein Tco_1351587 [Tanacetum coccineum]